MDFKKVATNYYADCFAKKNLPLPLNLAVCISYTHSESTHLND